MPQLDKDRTAPPQRLLVLALLGVAGGHLAPVAFAQPGMESARTMTPPPQATGAPPTAQPTPNAPLSAGGTGAPAPQGQIAPAGPGMAAPPFQPPAMSPAPPPMAPVPAMAPPPPPVQPVVAAPRAPVPPAPPTPPVKGLPAGSPPIVIHGATYSADPRLRLLIVNNQVVREGADLGGGVMLRQIGPEAAVLAVRGADYTVRY
jgi:general secretion pathway protein B